MNTIKDAIIIQSPQVQDYFRWRTHTIPKAYKPWSVGFLLALQVAMVSGIGLGAACSLFILLSGREYLLWVLIIISLAAMLLYLVLFYYLPLQRFDKGA
jgi:tellurite resistance protein TehA-like permease